MRRLLLLVLALLISSLPGEAQQQSVIVVRDSSTGVVIPNIGDDTNDAIRVNVVATVGGGGGGTSSNFGSAFPSAGTASGFTDGTNMVAGFAGATNSDGIATRTANVPYANAFLNGFNGTTWDRLRSTTANGLVVDVSRVQGTVASTQSGTWTVQPGNTANTTAWLVTGTGGTFPATQSGTWTVQPGNTANTTAWLVKPQRATSATLSNVTASATNTTCLSSSATRLGYRMHNDSTSAVFVKHGATASSTSYTYRVEGGGTLIEDDYSGAVDCIWVSANGAARMTDLQP